MLRITHSESYLIPLPEGHRFPIRKYELVRQKLEYAGVASSKQFYAPELMDEELIRAVHDPAYWDKVKNLTLTDKEIRRIGFPRHEHLPFRAWISATGTVRSAEQALQDGCGMNLAGGTHHSFFDRGEGFCTLNDVVISATHLYNAGEIKKALVLDLDVHQGNGTASLLKDKPWATTVSVHCEQNYPFKKVSSDLDIPVAAGTEDEQYLGILSDLLPGLLRDEKPDIVYYVSGIDILKDDRLGKLSISKHGCYLRDKAVISECRNLNIPLVVVMGGGYTDKLSTLVDAHANTYQLALEHYAKHQFFIN